MTAASDQEPASGPRGGRREAEKAEACIKHLQRASRIMLKCHDPQGSNAESPLLPPSAGKEAGGAQPPSPAHHGDLDHCDKGICNLI